MPLSMLSLVIGSVHTVNVAVKVMVYPGSLGTMHKIKLPTTHKVMNWWRMLTALLDPSWPEPLVLNLKGGNRVRLTITNIPAQLRLFEDREWIL